MYHKHVFYHEGFHLSVLCVVFIYYATPNGNTTLQLSSSLVCFCTFITKQVISAFCLGVQVFSNGDFPHSASSIPQSILFCYFISLFPIVASPSIEEVGLFIRFQRSLQTSDWSSLLEGTTDWTEPPGKPRNDRLEHAVNQHDHSCQVQWSRSCWWQTTTNS